MFGNLSEKALRTLFMARSLSLESGGSEISPGLILLALIVQEGALFRDLFDTEAFPQGFESYVKSFAPAGTLYDPGNVPLSVESKDVLILAQSLSSSRNSETDNKHLFLAILQKKPGILKLLSENGFSYEALEVKLLK